MSARAKSAGRRSLPSDRRIEAVARLGQQETILEQVPLRKFQYSERQGDDSGIEAASEKARNEILARSFLNIHLDARRGDLQTFQDSRKQIGSERRDYPHGNAKRPLLEPLSHRLEKQCFIQDPERLLMGIPAKWGEQETAALTFHQSPAQRCLEFTNLQRERRLGHVNALRRPAERTVFDQRLKIT